MRRVPVWTSTSLTRKAQSSPRRAPVSAARAIAVARTGSSSSRRNEGCEALGRRDDHLPELHSWKRGPFGRNGDDESLLLRQPEPADSTAWYLRTVVAASPSSVLYGRPHPVGPGRVRAGPPGAAENASDAAFDLRSVLVEGPRSLFARPLRIFEPEVEHLAGRKTGLAQLAGLGLGDELRQRLRCGALRADERPRLLAWLPVSWSLPTNAPSCQWPGERSRMVPGFVVLVTIGQRKRVLAKCRTSSPGDPHHRYVGDH